MAGVIFVALAPIDVERERFGPQGIAADPMTFGIGVIEQIERRMNAEAAAATEDCICLAAHDFLALLRRTIIR